MFALSMGMFTANLDSTILATAIPYFANEFHSIDDIDITGYGECWGLGMSARHWGYGQHHGGDARCTDGPAVRYDRHHLYTHGAQERTEALEKTSHDKGIKVDSRPVTRLVKGPGPSDVEVGFEDSTKRIEGFLVHKPKTEINGPFAEQLGLYLTSDGDIKTAKPFYSTSVSGVFAAGDCAMPMKAVVTAMSSGTLVAGGLAGQLQAKLYSGEQKLTQTV
ncbi:hypothetical protein LT330_003008 [Penicillium expansum]|nr:hypothetical protein LT330_003008 [Penicillium expansum]